MIRTHYLHDGVDNGSVSYKCELTGDYITPWHIDGCKKFDIGDPQEIIVNIQKENKDEKRSNVERHNDGK